KKRSDVICVLRKGICNEFQRWHQPGAELAPDLAAQHTCGGSERRAAGGTLLVSAQHRIERRSVLQVTRNADVSDGDKSETWVAQALLQAFRQDDADAIRQACLSFSSHFPSPL